MDICTLHVWKFSVNPLFRTKRVTYQRFLAFPPAYDTALLINNIYMHDDVSKNMYNLSVSCKSLTEGNKT